MTTIYSVSSGEDSDYAVNALFTTREKAEEYLEIHYGSEGYGFIEEYDLDPDTPNPFPPGLWPYRATTSLKVTPHKGVESNLNVRRGGIDLANKYETRDAIEGHLYEPSFRAGQDLSLFANVFGRDEEHARKIAIDLFRGALAGEKPFHLDGEKVFYRGIVDSKFSFQSLTEVMP
jgi:hypothetical protein